MRVVICLGLLMLAPIAGADQSIGAGPATVSTMNVEYGDGCDGTNGGAQREIRVHVDDPRPNGGTKDVVVGSGCNSYDDGSTDIETSYLYAYYFDFQFGQPGPSAYFVWYGGSYNGASWCGSSASMGSVWSNFGCPSPDGSAPPMLPVLP